MSEQEKPLRWLRKQNGEWQWAGEYLKERLNTEYVRRLGGDPKTRFSTYENLSAAIRLIKKDRLDLVIKLQGAIRLRRHRSDSNGKKPLTFTLSKETITKLNSIAKSHEGNGTAAVTALIEMAWKAAEAERNYEKQLKESVLREQKNAFQAVASMRTQRDEALKHAERYLKLLALWELAHPDEKPASASDEDIAQFVEPKMKELKDALSYLAFRDSVTTERFT